jgi:cell division protein FtsQ
MTTASPRARMDPRMRERRIQVQRALGRRRLRIISVVAAVVIAVGLVWVIANSPLFDVDEVAVTGTKNISVEDVRAAAHVKSDDALLFVDTGAVARRVKTLSWVKEVRVGRSFPGTLRISITEHQPTTFIRADNAVALVSAEGRVIAHVAVPPAGVLEVRGVRRPPADGELVSPPDAANVVGRLPAALASQVTAIDVSGNGLALVLDRGGAIRLGTADELDAKAAAALAVLADNGDAPFAYIDVSIPQTPVLRQ